MTHIPTIIPSAGSRKIRIGLVMMLSVLMLALASCTSRRAGISHNYDTPFGSGTVYVEGYDHGHKHKKPKKPKHKKPKKKKHHHHHD